MFNLISDMVKNNFIDIKLQDFNINVYGSEQSNLERVLNSYDMVVNDTNHISSLLLDQVFSGICSKVYIFQKVDVTSIVCSTFFLIMSQ